jgi:DNA-binding NtrC family response regulator
MSELKLRLPKKQDFFRRGRVSSVAPACDIEDKEYSRMAQVLALVDDLFFQAKLLETAKQIGVDVRTCATADALDAEIAKAVPKLIVVDLNATSNPLDAVARVQASGHTIPLIAFLSHVQVDLAERARAAGCSEVMPRSKFTQNMATILGRAKSEA